MVNHNFHSKLHNPYLPTSLPATSRNSPIPAKSFNPFSPAANSSCYVYLVFLFGGGGFFVLFREPFVSVLVFLAGLVKVVALFLGTILQF